MIGSAAAPTASPRRIMGRLMTAVKRIVIVATGKCVYARSDNFIRKKDDDDGFLIQERGDESRGVNELLL